MDKELRGLVVEIISIILLLIIVVPICVNASSEYRSKKDSVLVADKMSVDISNKGEFKQIKVSSRSNRVIKMNLMMKISPFNDDYIISLDDKEYDIQDLEYFEDDDFRYYNLGMYEVEKEKVFQFKIRVKDKSLYDESITYGFYTEGFM